MLDALNSIAFRSAMGHLAIVAVFVALGVIVVAFAYYGRGRETGDPAGPPWVLLMATWRDSLIITLLFTAQGFMVDATGFTSITQPAGYDPIFAIYTGQVVLNFVLNVLIFTVTSLRIIAISRWLAAKGAGA